MIEVRTFQSIDGKTVMVPAYKAFDGKLFASKKECEEYEEEAYELVLDNPIEVGMHNGRFYVGLGHGNVISCDSFNEMMGVVYYELCGGEYND